MKSTIKIIRVLTIATVMGLVSGYAAAGAADHTSSNPQAQPPEYLFKHSQDSREMRTIQRAKDTAIPPVRLNDPLFEHSRDGREFRYQRQEHSPATVDSAALPPIFKFTRDSREFDYMR